jgi:hypothetical protein
MKYHIKVPFTELYGLQEAIKIREKSAHTGNPPNKDPRHNKSLTDILKVKEKPSRVLHRMLVKKSRKPPIETKIKWENDIGRTIPIIKWRKHMYNSRKLTTNCKLQSWIYKYNLRRTPYNRRLFLMGQEDSEECNLCHKEQQTMKHLFWECSTVKPLWQNMARLTNLNIGIQEGYIGYSSGLKRQTKLENYCMLTRYYIHVCKCKNTIPNEVGQMNMIRCHKKREWECHSRNNTLGIYRMRWGDSNLNEI